jgi:hypothetical protein
VNAATGYATGAAWAGSGITSRNQLDRVLPEGGVRQTA